MKKNCCLDQQHRAARILEFWLMRRIYWKEWTTHTGLDWFAFRNISLISMSQLLRWRKGSSLWALMSLKNVRQWLIFISMKMTNTIGYLFLNLMTTIIIMVLCTSKTTNWLQKNFNHGAKGAQEFDRKLYRNPKTLQTWIMMTKSSRHASDSQMIAQKGAKKDQNQIITLSLDPKET